MATKQEMATRVRKKKRKTTKLPFPDLNKDGKVTYADILMGRGVIKKKSKKKNGKN